MKRKRAKRTIQKQNPPRKTIGVAFPRDLLIGVEAVAAMEGWSHSKTVVEIVRSVLAPGRRRR